MIILLKIGKNFKSSKKLPSDSLMMKQTRLPQALKWFSWVFKNMLWIKNNNNFITTIKHDVYELIVMAAAKPRKT